jgi:hypothetical protein
VGGPLHSRFFFKIICHSCQSLSLGTAGLIVCGGTQYPRFPTSCMISMHSLLRSSTQTVAVRQRRGGRGGLRGRN